MTTTGRTSDLDKPFHVVSQRADKRGRFIAGFDVESIAEADRDRRNNEAARLKLKTTYLVRAK